MIKNQNSLGHFLKTYNAILHPSMGRLRVYTTALPQRVIVTINHGYP